MEQGDYCKKGKGETLLPTTLSSKLACQEALGQAFDKAVNDFINRHGRNPDYDILNFNGGFTTCEVVVEIQEEVM